VGGQIKAVEALEKTANPSFDFMKVFTVATAGTGYFPVLQQTCSDFGYDLQVLGWERGWTGLLLKPELYVKALSDLPSEEIVLCVDAFDVFMIAPAAEVRQKFVKCGQPVLCSADREYTGIEWIQRIADKMMTDDLSFDEDKFPASNARYKRLNSGLIIGYAGVLRDVLIGAQKLISPGVKNDQTPLTKYYLRHPDKIVLDTQCAVFQSLAPTRGSLLWGSISGNDEGPDVRWEQQADGSRRLRNIITGEYPCVVHGFGDLDMTPLVGEAGYTPPQYELRRRLHLFRKVIYYVKRSLPFAVRYLAQSLNPTSKKSSIGHKKSPHR
jgi:hypothetical protein